MSEQLRPLTEQSLPDMQATALGSSSTPPTPSSSLNSFSVNSFVIENSFYRTRMPRPVHWSVAWSDLMMTMFILFLTMFVYQASHEEFLVSNTPEIIGGSTTEALDILGDGDLIVPIVPLSNRAPLINSGTVRKVEKILVEDINIDNVFDENTVYVEPSPDTTDNINGLTEVPKEIESDPASPASDEDILEPAPLMLSEQPVQEVQQETPFSEMYDMSQQALNNDDLGQFASIDLVPDTTMRIILTSDLLFFTGQADLSASARKSLKKLTAVIKYSPYMINVVGHTDSQPMHSSRFASNWELSVVRASSVARFLMNEMGMNPAQFIVSGYGSQRPRRPNNNVENRAANRRVEIIISKRLAPAIKATPNNLL